MVAAGTTSFPECLSMAGVPGRDPPLSRLCSALVVGLTVATRRNKLFRLMSVRLNVPSELEKEVALLI